MMGWIRNGLSALLLALVMMTSVQAMGLARAEATMTVSANGHVVETLTPGLRIGVTVRGLPATRRAYCLPVSLGRVARDPQGTARVTATVPPRLFPAEPPGPYLLFVGVCTAIAPDRPFVARTTIHIVPA